MPPPRGGAVKYPEEKSAIEPSCFALCSSNRPIGLSSIDF